MEPGSFTVVLTRPASDGAQLAEQLPCPVILSPVIEIEPVGDIGPLPAKGGLILTSRHAVHRLTPSPTPAYCVGTATTEAARAKGLTAIDAGGDADALVARMSSDAPPGTWLHLRGAQTRGRIAQRLNAAGLNVQEQIIYRQTPRSLTPEARAALESGQGVVLPLFSPFSARLALQDIKLGQGVVVIAMSQAVAEAARTADAQDVIIAAQPTRNAMVESIAMAIGRSPDRLRAGGSRDT